MAAEAPPFSPSHYLRLLAGKASPSWLNELTLDGGVELDFDPVLQGSDLIEPLKTFAFPADRFENLDDVLSSILIGYSSGLEDGESINDFKIIYVASLYLHCHSNTAKTTGVASLACALIARCAVRLPKDERLHVYRFLLWILQQEERNGDYRLDFPKASILLCAYIVDVDTSEALLERANVMFQVERSVTGPSPDEAAIKATLEQAANIEPSLDANLVLEQIEDASPLHDTSIKIFRSVLQQANIDATKVAMLNPTD